MACGSVSLKPHIGLIDTIQFRQMELCYHVAISSTSNSHCLTSLIFKEILSSYASSLKSIPIIHVDKFVLAKYMWVPRSPKAALSGINKPIKIKMCYFRCA
ncbi:hypothetical protein HHI36_000872 [Cryptolaemus montrouzieri]|uniref:Uncharacterized protein n=1 Tax=Cryptolaemus montrouzieri TaxID=559131 RepID=A0ABD2P652_9CUCU